MDRGGADDRSHAGGRSRRTVELYRVLFMLRWDGEGAAGAALWCPHRDERAVLEVRVVNERQKRGRNSKQRSKAIERDVARLYGGQRIGDTGGHFADVQNLTHVIEVKSRQMATPALIREAWDQAETAAKATGKDPLVVLSYLDHGRRVYWEVRKVEG